MIEDTQSFHRLRRQPVGKPDPDLLAENGIVMRKGVSVVRCDIPERLEDADNGLSERFRALLCRQQQRFPHLDKELIWYKAQLTAAAKSDEACRRLSDVTGFGPVASSAFKSWIADGTQCKRGRDASAALGVVPRQHSTGGKDVLLGISKRGDSYVRSLVIHGARSVVSQAEKKTDLLSVWINR